MQCFHPLYVFQSQFLNPETGKSIILFPKKNKNNILNPEFSSFVIKPPDGFDIIRIPCGNCLGCMLNRSREWAIRCMHEMKVSSCGCFVTLTIDSKRKLYDGMDYSLNRRDIQLFIKRLRKHFFDQKIRYFYCGEYGARRSRPHYHLLLFGIDFPDKVLWRVNPVVSNYSTYNKPIVLYRSSILESLWPFGFSTIGELNYRTSAYTARYCLKKSGIISKKEHYGDKTPEFIGCSLKPGLGYEYFLKFYNDFYSIDACLDPDYRKVKVPRYYDKLYERFCPDRFLEIKESRKLRALTVSDSEFLSSRLFQKEQICKMKVEELIRSYENAIENF